MRPSVSSAVLAAVAVASGPVAAAAHMASSDQHFFHEVEGQWSGPGEIVAGKYKGTRFTCDLKGTTPEGHPGMMLNGTCRVGVFTQKMSARVEKRGRSYRGAFLDGAEGKGLDIVGGSVEGQSVVFALDRHQLHGTMAARLAGDNRMDVTISVRVDKQLVPVIGVSLKRVEGASADNFAQD